MKHFYMNRAAFKGQTSGFLYSLIATEKSGDPFEWSLDEIMVLIINSAIDPV